jgi:2-hydroxy-3-keto-5-methylthiopentenyl-1-phosphate phosphatase
MRTQATALTNSQSGLRPIVFSDFDGTITQIDVTDRILSELAHPSWEEVEQEWARGMIGSRECLARQMALVDAPAGVLDTLIDSIPLDPHFAAFRQFLRKRRVPFYVVSDGFDYVIRRVLERSGVNGTLRNGSHLFSSSLRIEGNRLVTSFPHSPEPCEHGCATCKAAIIRRLSHEHRPIIFIGDGLSDRFAIELSDVVFAKRQLLAYCREREIACTPFETFADIQAAMAEDLAGTAPKLKRRRSKAQEGSLVLSNRYC